MKKRITMKDWDCIGTYNSGAKWVRPFCVYTLEEVQKGTVKQEIKIGWFAYLLMFILSTSSSSSGVCGMAV